MKITKQQLKQIIKEELKTDKALTNAISMLTTKIEALDISIDYLAASLVGGDPHHIQVAQTHLGRGHRPSGKGIKVQKEQLSQLVKKELQNMLSERGFGEGEPAKDEWSKKKNVSLEEEDEDIEEKKLTEPEKEEKEEIIQGMKDEKDDFEKRYPGRGEEVMYATATKMAKKRK